MIRTRTWSKSAIGFPHAPGRRAPDLFTIAAPSEDHDSVAIDAALALAEARRDGELDRLRFLDDDHGVVGDEAAFERRGKGAWREAAPIRWVAEDEREGRERLRL